MGSDSLWAGVPLSVDEARSRAAHGRGAMRQQICRPGSRSDGAVPLKPPLEEGLRSCRGAVTGHLALPDVVTCATTGTFEGGRSRRREPGVEREVHLATSRAPRRCRWAWPVDAGKP